MFSNALHCSSGDFLSRSFAAFLVPTGDHAGMGGRVAVLVDDPLDLAGADQVAEPAFGYLHHVGGLGVADLLGRRT